VVMICMEHTRFEYVNRLMYMLSKQLYVYDKTAC
jgi:hypothetical protein